LWLTAAFSMAVDYTKLVGLRVAITLILSHIFEFDAFNDELELCTVQCLFLARRFVVVEAAFLQPLCPNTKPAAIEIQYFYLSLTAIDIHKNVAAQRILTDHVFGHRCQAVERSSHIRGFGIEPDPNLGLREKHQRVRTRNTIPAPNSSSTCQWASS